LKYNKNVGNWFSTTRIYVDCNHLEIVEV